jgi:hypothetical protein
LCNEKLCGLEMRLRTLVASLAQTGDRMI